MVYNKETHLWEIDSKIYLTDEEFQEYINTIFEDKEKELQKSYHNIEYALSLLNKADEQIKELMKIIKKEREQNSRDDSIAKQRGFGGK